jgi:UDP:flavonoid glycosyltransferase YjiC (YdhE family)
MWSGHSFLEQSARACELLGKRGLLLTRHREHLPPSLPQSVLHVDFAPFSELLPRCAVLVHHGGIGTTAQALARGIPQLVVPHAHDQPDNAHRVEGLGVGRKLEPKEYRAPLIARVLGELLGSPDVKSRCRDLTRRFAGADPIAQTCDLIEGLAPQRAVFRD